MSLLRVLVAGVDTLVLTYVAPVPTERIESLLRLKSEARSKRDTASTEPTVVTLADREWLVRPQSAPPYRFLLHRPDEMDIALAGRTTLSAGTPTLKIELRSEFLWGIGYRAAAACAQRVAQELLGSPAECLERVARVDLCADFQGWKPTGEDDEQRRFVRRVRKAIDRHGADEYFTGYSIGLGLLLSVRLYDKSAEIGTSGKRWFYDLWRQGGMLEPRAPVWRLELQARGEWLEEVGLRADWTGNVEPNLDQIWRYAFGHPEWNPSRDKDPLPDELRELRAKRRELRELGGELSQVEETMLTLLSLERKDDLRNEGAWLSLRDPSDDENRSRHPISPAWRALQQVVFVDPGAPAGMRLTQREAQIDNLRTQIAGLLASLGALAGVQPREGGTKEERLQISLWDAWIEFQRRQLVADRVAERDFTARLGEKGAARARVHEIVLRERLPPSPWVDKLPPDKMKRIGWDPAELMYGPVQANARPWRSFIGAQVDWHFVADGERAVLAEQRRRMRFAVVRKSA